MQIPSLRPGASALERHPPGAPTVERHTSGVAAVPHARVETALRGEPVVARGPTATPTAGLTSFDGELNRRVAGAQQALEFLDALESGLHKIKSEQSRGLSRGEPVAGSSLDGELEALRALLRQRNSMTAGSLDGGLRLVSPGEARQGFAVRGLDRAALVSGGRENLTFNIGDGREVGVVVDSDLPPRTAIRRLDEALRPAGVRVTGDAVGEPRFSVREADWPQLADSFAVRGGGRRFPAGAFNRVVLDPEPEAVRVPTLGDGPDAQRAMLHEVLGALDVVRRARAVVSDAIVSARARFDDSRAAVETLWAADFVREFEVLAERSGYDVFAAIGPALAAVSRPRVVALLRLD